MAGKRRADGEGSITWDADAQRWVGRLPRDARGRRAKVKAKTKAEVVAKLRKRLRERDLGIDVDTGRLTVAAFLDRWVCDHVAPSDLSPRTIEAYERVVRLHVTPGLGRIKLVKLAPVHVQRFISEELAAGKGRRTVQQSHAVLRNALSEAVRWGLVARNVAAMVRGPSYRSSERKPFTVGEQRAILSAAVGERVFVLVVLAQATGLRQSELLGIRWRDVDLDAGILRARKQLGRDGTLRDLKTEAGRRAMPLPAPVVAVLREHRRRQAAERERADWWEDHDLVYCTRQGRPVNQRNAHRAWTRIVEAAGVEHRGIHHLRHSYGTSLAERGVHERVAQYLLGHSDSRTTRDIYTHVSDRMMDAAVDAITAVVEEVTPPADRASGSRSGSPAADDATGPDDATP